MEMRTRGFVIAIGPSNVILVLVCITCTRGTWSFIIAAHGKAQDTVLCRGKSNRRGPGGGGSLSRHR